jgi:hypothetical protein
MFLNADHDTLQVLASRGVQRSLCSSTSWFSQEREAWQLDKDLQKDQFCLKEPCLSDGLGQRLFGQGPAIQRYQGAPVHLFNLLLEKFSFLSGISSSVAQALEACPVQ